MQTHASHTCTFTLFYFAASASQRLSTGSNSVFQSLVLMLSRLDWTMETAWWSALWHDFFAASSRLNECSSKPHLLYLSCSDHIIYEFISLHRLRVPHSIIFKIIQFWHWPTRPFAIQSVRVTKVPSWRRLRSVTILTACHVRLSFPPIKLLVQVNFNK